MADKLAEKLALRSDAFDLNNTPDQEDSLSKQSYKINVLAAKAFTKSIRGAIQVLTAPVILIIFLIRRQTSRVRNTRWQRTLMKSNSWPSNFKT